MAANEYYSNNYSQKPHPPIPHDNDNNGDPWSHQQASSPTATPGGYGHNYDNGSRYGHYHSNSDNDMGDSRMGHNNDYYSEDIPLKPNAANNSKPDWADDTRYHPSSHDLPTEPLNLSDPVRRPSRRRKQGYFAKKIAWVTYITSLVQIVVFIVELVRNAQLTGSPIMTKPSFNPMIGPSPYVQINLGARFVPCMRNVDKLQNSPDPVVFPCPNTTTTEPKCRLSELCGFDGVPDPKPGGSLDDKPEPNQWFRFIVPMFLHAGLVHIGFNLFAQLSIGADMERAIGWWRYAIVYFSSGIFGFVLGGNFAAPAIASTGASGCLFGIFALCVLDLFYTWGKKQRPWVDLMFMLITVAISFVLGLLPGLDNFSHIGGFLTGLVLGICILRSPDTLRERIGVKTPYVSMGGNVGADEDQKKFYKQPVSFFQGRKPLWWGWWLLRAGALIGIIVSFIVLINNFYKYRTTCSWCKYLSCLPISNWCEIGDFTTTPISKNTRNFPF
ncbi:rhomboid family membrane protein [Nannizzia gypsea CBS 118893]|uniref:Rhomboid-type serine protease n=1 Tax=Arthroderma gypseum (strain ATCC MYA-4604 / CBS 118893) TaxID=535722 RepID=E4V470_ARTGP|nr:rhomboid family membrane protein [Nannizzia gypsea CBS 118893]EFR04794.1 rhomboid family membrane protein [Nannizzia gypsea CBS 118893]